MNLQGPSSKAWIVSGAIALLMLTACSSLNAEDIAEVTLEPSPSSTPARFQPTITPIPPPTELPTIVFPTVTATPLPTPTPTRDPNQPGLTMSPNLGELDQSIRITAFGFVPDSSAALYWTRPNQAPSGTAFQHISVSDEGTFALNVTIPAQWPGGQPAELEFLELRVIGDENRQAWATYRYVVPFTSPALLGLTYNNSTYSYTIDLPTDWDLQDADAADVRFGATGSGLVNFIQVISNADVDATIDSLMDQLAPGASLTSEASSIGVESATKVTVDGSGLVYWFVGHGGQTYVLHIPQATHAIGGFRFS